MNGIMDKKLDEGVESFGKVMRSRKKEDKGKRRPDVRDGESPGVAKRRLKRMRKWELSLDEDEFDGREGL